MINLIWLKTFCTLVEVGHFTKTAELLYMTQSGVSQQVKKLEQQLGTALLIREGKSFSLTDAGIKLNQQGQNLLQRSAELEKAIKYDDQYTGTVSIASPGSIGLTLYPYMLDIQQQHATLSIDYKFAPNKNIAQDLVERKIDIGLVTELSKAENIVSQKVTDEPLVLVTSHDISRISWEKLTKIGFINHPDGQHHAQLLLSKNFPQFEHISQLSHRGFSNQISLILEPVSRGIGFTVLPLNAVNAFGNPQALKVHALENSVNETLYLCQNRHTLENNRSKFIKSKIINFII
ncbi:LysR family transcriptional regulator [Colwellia polaris]|jgi:DNA-binding transcriptional LysR family regulator|uniref:LysR family transcriptional regulator n=1 Tax=Colwellia polaris TaxID=326537 RepID=UPI000A16EE25|nr:LysR family transcriptional regulator [Colwellia polaris]|tara:strand:+ start:507 stop:1379 length:873 start_codon:yes stop_codon:yes gene_type:complete